MDKSKENSTKKRQSIVKVGYIFILSVFLAFEFPEALAQNNSTLFEKSTVEGIQKRQIPGMITVVYHQDSLVFSQTYGFRNLEKELPVDPLTVFNLGSATKPFIGIAMAMLVEQGKIDWKDKVIDHYPSFKLSDSCTTKDARIKDLFLHNLGIAANDLLWTLDSTSTEEMLERYALSEKIHPIRAGFEYNNMLYVIAGEVIQAVSGKHWTNFVEEHIFQPLGMKRSFARAVEVPSYGNYATPYLYQEGKWLAHPLNLADQMGAAGNIWSSLEDMENFLEFLVDEGSYQGNQLLSKESFEFLFEPHTLESNFEMNHLYEGLETNFRAYGLGWFLHDYRGLKVAYHPGSIEGLNAQIGYVPSQKLAFFTMCNRDWAELWRSIFYKAIDLWVFQDDSRDHSSLAINPSEPYLLAWEAEKEKDKNPNQKAGIPKTALTGIYKHPMYGDAEVKLNEDQIIVRFNDYLTFELEHWFGDTYLGETQEKFLGWDDYFEFQPNVFLAFGTTFTKQ